MDIPNFVDFKKRITKDFIKYNAFQEFYDDVMVKADQLYLKVKNNDIYTNKSTYITCILISNKFIIDKPYNNRCFSKLFFIDLKKLNDMEMFCLNKINWDLVA